MICTHITSSKSLSKILLLLIITDGQFGCHRQARGTDGHNIVTLAMHELDTDLNGALDWVSRYNDDNVEQFMEIFRNLPSWGEPLDAQVGSYVEGLGNYVRAHDSWCFEVCTLRSLSCPVYI